MGDDPPRVEDLALRGFGECLGDDAQINASPQIRGVNPVYFAKPLPTIVFSECG